MHIKETAFPSVTRLIESSIYVFFLETLYIVNNQISSQLPERFGTKSCECASAARVSVCMDTCCLFLSHTPELLLLTELRKFLQLLFTESITFLIHPPSQIGALLQAHYLPLPAPVGRALKSRVTVVRQTSPCSRGGDFPANVCFSATVQLRRLQPASIFHAVYASAKGRGLLGDLLKYTCH